MRLNVRLMRPSPAAARRLGTLCSQWSCSVPRITSRLPPPSAKQYLSVASELRRSRKSRGAPNDTEAARTGGKVWVSGAELGWGAGGGAFA